MLVIVTFDLKDAEENDYKTAYALLEKLGLYDVSLHKSLQLPNTTVMGEFTEDIKASNLRDYIWNYFKKNDLTPSNIFGGVLDDWAVKVSD